MSGRNIRLHIQDNLLQNQIYLCLVSVKLICHLVYFHDHDKALECLVSRISFNMNLWDILLFGCDDAASHLRRGRSKECVCNLNGKVECLCAL